MYRLRTSQLYQFIPKTCFVYGTTPVKTCRTQKPHLPDVRFPALFLLIMHHFKMLIDDKHAFILLMIIFLHFFTHLCQPVQNISQLNSLKAEMDIKKLVIVVVFYLFQG